MIRGESLDSPCPSILKSSRQPSYRSEPSSLDGVTLVGGGVGVRRGGGERGVRAPEALAELPVGYWEACQGTPWLGAPTPPTRLRWFCLPPARAPPACAQHRLHTTLWPRSSQRALQTQATKVWPIRRLGTAACPMTAC
ncbi:hypothetical protein FQA47_001988 [Oryzias melastigma]|uniref:Uncharacterized protein n=1 Tax=Oryzias melastigma TaxID=30732 RepID=A0A834CHH1_ORYME|nr:hypothetical protein FQA47_001988 [Oryzias melastigma]